MPKITVIELSAAQRAALESGHRNGAGCAFRRRCQMILLKSQGRTSSQVAEIVGVCEMSVHNWVHRYQHEGIAGLETRPGRGRKAILQEQDLESVRQVVAEHRQRLSLAKAELEQALGKSFSQETLARFVKKTVDATSACENVRAASRCRKFINSKSRA
jgi:transposase